jgi:hypothetical protein
VVTSEVGKYAGNGGTFINLDVIMRDRSVQRHSIRVERLVIAGWTGRDSEAVAAHVRELEEVGVKPPSSIPVFYRAGVDTLTTLPSIEVVGAESSGEVEAVFLSDGSEIFVAVGSDQTDRKVESYSIAVSKQMCPKPISQQVWRYADVADHWDQLVMRSWAVFGVDRRLYQDGSASNLLHPEALFQRFTDGTPILPPATAMYGGTLSAIGGIRPMDSFEMELEDPVLQRRIRHAYAVKRLPEIS